MLVEDDDFQMFSWVLIIQFSYGVVTTIIYTLTVLILWRNWKHFDAYFFKLYIYQYIFNMIMYWNFYIAMRLPASTCDECFLSSWFSSMSATSKFSFPFFISIFLQFHLGFVNYTNVLLTSFNRFTTIFMNKSYARIWHFGTYPIILILLLLPIIFTHPLLTNHAYLDYNPTSDTFVSRSLADLSELYLYLLPWMALTTSLSIVLNVLCWTRISKYSQASRQQSDYRLFLFSFVTFFIQLVVFGIAVLNKISADRDPTKTFLLSRIGQTLSPFGNDLLTLTAPYVLVVFSKRIRKAVKLLFVNGAFNPSSGTPVQNIRASRSVVSKIVAA